MAGLAKDTPIPSEIKLHQASRLLELGYEDGSTYQLSFEYLRVFSPSAAVRGHGVGNGVLQTGKHDVDIVGVEPVGNYALKLIFSDGHDSGLYSWDVFYELATQQATLWQDYLARLEAAGASRFVDSTTPKPEAGKSCKSH
jgi:DUF971 family protein